MSHHYGWRSFLVKMVAFKVKHKLSDKQDRKPYSVFGHPNLDIKVFTVQREDGEGRKKNLYRNLLLPVGDITEILVNKGNNKITELRTILQRESPNS